MVIRVRRRHIVVCAQLARTAQRIRANIRVDSCYSCSNNLRKIRGQFMVIRVRRRHIVVRAQPGSNSAANSSQNLFSVCVFCVRLSSPRAARHRYRYQLSITLQGVCGNYILSILPSKRAFCSLGSGTLLEGADGVEAWDGMLAYQAQASMPSIRCSKSIQSQMKFFFSYLF